MHKPSFQYVIDWSHPLAKGLTGVWLFNNSVNLAASEDGVFNTSSAPNRLHGAVEIDGVGNLQISGADQCVEVGPKAYHNGDLSIVARITLATSQIDTTPTIFSADSSVSGIREWQFRLDSTDHLQFIPFVGGTNGSIVGSTALTRTQMYSVGCSHSSIGSSNIKVYLDGIVDGTGTHTGSLNSNGSNKGIGARLLSTVVASGSDIVDELIGEFEFTYCYDRELSPDEFESLHTDPYQFLKLRRTVDHTAFFQELTGDNLLADDLQSISELDNPAINQIHALIADGLNSTAELDTPAISQIHPLIADGLNSTAELDTPILVEVSDDVLLADDLQSVSELGMPVIGQIHALIADGLNSTVELSNPVLLDFANADNLLADDLQSISELDNPAINQTHVLFSDSLNSTAEISSASLAQFHALTSNDVQSNIELTNPSLTEIIGSDNLLADNLQSVSELGNPAISQIHALALVNIQSISEFSSPGLIKDFVIGDTKQFFEPIRGYVFIEPVRGYVFEEKL